MSHLISLDSPVSDYIPPVSALYPQHIIYTQDYHLTNDKNPLRNPKIALKECQLLFVAVLGMNVVDNITDVSESQSEGLSLAALGGKINMTTGLDPVVKAEASSDRPSMYNRPSMTTLLINELT